MYVLPLLYRLRAHEAFVLGEGDLTSSTGHLWTVERQSTLEQTCARLEISLRLHMDAPVSSCPVT